MHTPKISHHLAFILPLCAAVLGGSTAALATGDRGAPGVAFVLDAVTTVVDQALLECRSRTVSGTMAIDLKIAGNWTNTDGDILDLISASSSISAVTSRFEPEPGDEHRMRFKVHGSPTWGPWSAWTTSRIAHVTAVPGAGLMNVDEFETNARQAGSQSPVIASHGYIKIKKLNSGG